MKGYIKDVLPKTFIQKIIKLREIRFKKIIRIKKLIDLKIGNISIKVPKGHPLLERIESQPHRNLELGISTKFFSQKYPNKTILDIGANIGDTAAMISSYSNNPIILVEPSEIFYSILEKNLDSLPNVKKVEKVLIADEVLTKGTLIHQGGTAYFSEKYDFDNTIPSKKISDVADNNTKFVKIDTDGFDFLIINSSIEWLSTIMPILYFENQINSEHSLNEANQTFTNLYSIGYKYFIVWDDPGFHILSTEDISYIYQLNYYLYKIHSNIKHRISIHNFNILCVPELDKDVYESIDKFYKKY